MVITITQTVFGFHIAILSDDRSALLKFWKVSSLLFQSVTTDFMKSGASVVGQFEKLIQ